MPINMINLETYFKNCFETSRLVDLDIHKFAEDHLGRMTANNPGAIYASNITATDTMTTDFFTALSSKDSGLSVQQGKTIVMNLKLNDFKNAVQDIESFIKYTYRAAPGTYEEFFPQGLTEYGQATLGNTELLMNRMVDRLTAHVAEMLAANVTLFTNLRTAFTGARDEQVFQFGTVEGANTLKQTTRAALVLQLMKNLLLIASNNIGHPERMNDYFDQSIIRNATGGTDDSTIEGEVAAGVTVNIESEGITDLSKFRLKNTGTPPLAFCLAPDEVTASPGVKLTTGQEATVTADMLGAAGNHFLNVTNPDPTAKGNFEVEIL